MFHDPSIQNCMQECDNTIRDFFELRDICDGMMFKQNALQILPYQDSFEACC